MEQGFPARRIGYGLLAAALVLAGGTVGFHQILDENWMSSFYRAVITTSLAGIDSVPDNGGGQALSVVLIFSGVTIFAFLGAVLVEAIARGVLSGAERRRKRAIERLRGHTIICGYGRVGRRIADEFRGAGAGCIVVDNDPDEVEAAREAGMLALEGGRDRGRGSTRGRSRAREGADRGARFGCEQPVCDALGEDGPA